MSNFPDGDPRIAAAFAEKQQHEATAISGDGQGVRLSDYSPLLGDAVELSSFIAEASTHHLRGVESLVFERRRLLGPMWKALDPEKPLKRPRPLILPGEGFVATELRSHYHGVGFVIGRMINEDTGLEMPVALATSEQVYGKREPRGVNPNNVFAPGKSHGKGYGRPLLKFYGAHFEPGLYKWYSYEHSAYSENQLPKYQVFVAPPSGTISEVLDKHRSKFGPLHRSRKHQ